MSTLSQSNLLSRIVVASVVLAGLHAAAQVSGEGGTAAGSTAFDSALARQRDADTLRALSADGQVLYQRERVKLDGYQYCSQAVAAAERGDFRDSVRAASKALFIGERQGNEDLVALSKRDLAIAYSYAGDLDRAAQYAQESLGHAAKNPAVVVGPAYKTLGDVAVRQSRLDQAIAYYAQAETGSSDRYRPLVQISLANAYVSQKNTKKARELYDRIPPPQGSLLPLYERGLGNLLLAEGRPDEALKAFEVAARSAKGPDASYQRLWALDGIGRSQLALGQRDAARKTYGEATQLADGIRSRFRSEEFKTGLFGDVQDVFSRAIVLQVEAGDPATAWQTSEQSRSRALLDVLRGRVTPVADGGGSTVATSLADVQASLHKDETIVQFHSLDDRLLVWTITSKGLSGRSIPLPRAELDAAIDQFRLAVFERRRAALDAGAALYSQLLAPLALAQGERLLFVPHGSMHYLPFQALRIGDSFLIERHAMSLAPSASIAVQFGRRDQSVGASLVAFGNPTNTGRDALPGAEREVQSIGRLFPGARVFLRQQASKSSFGENAGSGRILHIAAHAEVDSLDPLQSRILLAAEGGDTGFLTAREIYGVDLKSVSLVTISACESGLGRIARGDEVLGFTRSFLSAGASGLLVSLWPVADNSTELLMSTFYDRLAQGALAVDAMRSAQIEVLRTPRFAHPFFWAPFVLIGDWRLGFGA